MPDAIQVNIGRKGRCMKPIGQKIAPDQHAAGQGIVQDIAHLGTCLAAQFAEQGQGFFSLAGLALCLRRLAQAIRRQLNHLHVQRRHRPALIKDECIAWLKIVRGDGLEHAQIVALQEKGGGLCVLTTTELPPVSTVCRSRRMEDVGLIAIDTVTSWPVEMPPSTPPALLERKPSGSISSECSVPNCSTLAKPAPISTPLTALMPIIAWAIAASSRS